VWKQRQKAARSRRGFPRDIETESELKKYMCLICGWIYDEADGAPEEGIAPGTRWEDVPPNWTCPECGARKEDFEMIEI
jgi:rubredoxin